MAMVVVFVVILVVMVVAMFPGLFHCTPSRHTPRALHSIYALPRPTPHHAWLARSTLTLRSICSGIGKSSLMRAVAGLWADGAGQITRPPPDKTLFLSQKPYLTLGSLRDNVLYPSPDGGE